MTTGGPPPSLSVVVPARDEGACLGPVVRELLAVLDALRAEGRVGACEILVVDDASADETASVLARLAADDPRVRPVPLSPVAGGGANGQTAALAAGVARSRGDRVACLDGDGQNDPAALGPMLARLDAGEADLVQGRRVGRGRDGLHRVMLSEGARLVRRAVLSDPTRDAGCTLRVMTRSVAAALPLDAPGRHRFVPALARARGARVVEHPVDHRARLAGRSHYAGPGRLVRGLRDAFAVRALVARRGVPAARPLTPPAVRSPAHPRG